MTLDESPKYEISTKNMLPVFFLYKTLNDASWEYMEDTDQWMAWWTQCDNFECTEYTDLGMARC